MANKQIDALAAFTTPATGTDIIHAKQGGVDKKITVSQLRSEVGSVSNFYTAAGINTITLAAAGNSVGLTEYSDGLVVSFFATTTNTAGVTWNVNSLGGRSAVINGLALTGAEITTSELIEGVYDLANTRFEIISPASHKRVNDALTETIAGNKTFTGSSNVYNGISQTNLLDKSATETVSGDWNFTGAGNTFNGVLQSNLTDKSAITTISGKWFFSDVTSTFGGVTASNLLDKSAIETVSGQWNFTNASNIFNGISQANLLDKSADETVGGNWNFTGIATTYNGILQSNLVDKSAAETIVGNWDFSNDLKINGSTVRSTGEEFDTDGITVSLAADVFDVITVTHGLGTDDIMCEVRAIGNGVGRESYWNCTVYYPDDTSQMFFGSQGVSSGFSTAPTTLTGTAKVYIKNTASITQTITYKLIVRKRVI